MPTLLIAWQSAIRLLVIPTFGILEAAHPVSVLLLFAILALQDDKAPMSLPWWLQYLAESCHVVILRRILISMIYLLDRPNVIQVSRRKLTYFKENHC